MMGSYHVEVYNSNIKFILDINRKVSVISGESGTGKSTLYSMIKELNDNPETSAVKCNVGNNVIALTSDNWRSMIKQERGKVFFVDDFKFVLTKEFAKCVSYSDNCFIIMSRSTGLKYLPYNTFEFRTEGGITRMFMV